MAKGTSLQTESDPVPNLLSTTFCIISSLRLWERVLAGLFDCCWLIITGIFIFFGIGVSNVVVSLPCSSCI